MDEVNCMIRYGLDGMEDGLYFYRAITETGTGIILFRVVGFYMKSDAAREKMWQLFGKNKFEDIEIRQDLAGLTGGSRTKKKLQEEKMFDKLEDLLVRFEEF